jgi:hypothetical protein
MAPHCRPAAGPSDDLSKAVSTLTAAFSSRLLAAVRKGCSAPGNAVDKVRGVYDRHVEQLSTAREAFDRASDEARARYDEARARAIPSPTPEQRDRLQEARAALKEQLMSARELLKESTKNAAQQLKEALKEIR